MKRTACLLACLLVLTAAWPQRVARGEDAAAYVPTADEVQRVATRQACYPRQRCCRPRRKAWQFKASVPVWIPGVSGTFGEGGIEVDADSGVGDVLDDLFDVETNLDFAFVGSFDARRGPWVFSVEGFGVKLGNSLNFKLIDGTLVDAKIGAIIASARAGYRVWTRPFHLFGRRACFEVDAFAGLRYYYASFNVTLPLGIRMDASNGWIDPIVGLDTRLTLSRHLSLRVKGDVGGFGVGADIAWWLVTELEYRFSRLFSLSAGWGFMDADYSSGSGDDAFRWNLTLSGPMLIAGFRF